MQPLTSAEGNFGVEPQEEHASKSRDESRRPADRKISTDYIVTVLSWLPAAEPPEASSQNSESWRVPTPLLSFYTV